jgi:hypothetical protein
VGSDGFVDGHYGLMVVVGDCYLSPGRFLYKEQFDWDMR